MRHGHLPKIIALARYRAVIAALEPERESWLGEYWLRFAAHLAVLSPDDPTHVAKRLCHLAAELHAQATWFRDLASPLRFVIAAQLIQRNLRVHDFLGEHARISDLLRTAGLMSTGFHHTMTVLMLISSLSGSDGAGQSVERLKYIYFNLKRFPWWLISVTDLPTCTALVHCQGTAEDVVRRTEACNLQLKNAGLTPGDHLQTAACLLPLTGLAANDATGRYLALNNEFESRSAPLLPTDYETIAILSLLDHDPQLIVDRLLTVRQELELLQPEAMRATNFIIAADLTCLDLIRYDRAMAPIAMTRDEPVMRNLLRAFQLATSAVASRIDQDLTVAASDTADADWPLNH